MNPTNTIERPHHTPNLFFPILLIGAGVILLLTNLGMVTQNPVLLLVQFWPLLLIVAGIQLFFERTGVLSTVVSVVLGLAVVAAAVLYVTLPGERVAPTWFDWNWNWFPRSGELHTQSISKPLEGAHIATANINLPSGRGSIKPVNDTANLVEGDFTYLGTLTTNVTHSGDTANIVVDSTHPNNGLEFLMGPQRWDVRLNPSVPLDLALDVGSGAHEFDLRGFQVKGITLDQGSGDTTFRLPEKGQYHFKIDLGSGSLNVVMPKGLPVRVTHDIGSGSLNVYDTYRANGWNQKGTYETDGFNQTGDYVIFDVGMGSGSVTIR